MKTTKYILIFLFLGIIFCGITSCKDFLDTNPSTSVADSDVFTTIGGAQAALNGAYYHMRAYNSGGHDDYDDYGLPSVLLISDACGEDIIYGGGWYIYNYNYWGETRSDIFRSSQLWVFHYRLINNVNSIITYIDDCDGSEQDKQYIKGQALAIRGWAYFDLARLFQQTYSIAQNMPGMPIYTEPTSESTEGKPRGTLKETYDQVLSDLLEAEKLLEGFNRGTRVNTFDQTVVQGVLAQVYQVMHDWEKCEQYAKKVLDMYPLTSNEEYLNGFNDETTPSWIWAMRQTEEQNMGDYSLFAMWANNTRQCFSFNGYYVADEFMKLFDEDDIRASQFMIAVESIDSDTGELLSRTYSSYKFRDNDECRGSIVFMRSDEMQLNVAEALASQGKEAEAKEYLWKLQDMRNARRSQTTGQELIEEIWLERRKELYGEGHALFDMIRNQQPLVRAGNHENYGGSFSLPSRAWRFIFQLPTAEMLNNESLVDGIWPNGDQNPYDGVYEP